MNNFFRRHIPGHARAITLILMLLFSAVGYALTQKAMIVLGTVMFFAGLFLADQATHLNQPNHSDPAETGLERQLQKHRIRYSGIGVITALSGFIILLAFR